MNAWWPRMRMAVGSSIALGALLAMPMMALASGPFDINALPVDGENRFSNVGAVIAAFVDDDGNPVAPGAHCSGTLIHERVFLTAGHCTGSLEFPWPSFIAFFVSLGA